MKITIDNFMGCRHAEIALDGITLIAGGNAQGKTSLLTATALALAGLSEPPGVKKKEHGNLLRDGTESGRARIDNNGSITEIRWPDGEVAGSGGDFSSLHAVGFTHFVGMDAKGRASFFCDALDAYPTIEDFRAALDKASPEAVDKLWAKIEKDGWNATHGAAKEHGARLKGQWQQITGENYGSDKAGKWIPGDWNPQLEGAEVDALEFTAANAKQELENAIGREAVVDAAAGDADTLAEQFAEAKSAETQAQKLYDDALISAREISVPAHSLGLLYCAHCGEPNIMVMEAGAGALKLPPKKPLSRTEIAKRQRATTKAQAKIIEAKNAWDAAKGRQIIAERQLEAANKAKPGLAREVVDAKREEADKAQERLDMVKARADARTMHERVAQNQTAIDVLAPAGLRKEAIKAALDDFNIELGNISRSMSLGAVTIDSDMIVYMDGRDYRWLSASERWRTRLVLQLAFAALFNEAAIIVDAFEIVEPSGRGAVLKALAMSSNRALIAVTVSKPDGLPDLAKGGHGETYWMEDGEPA